MIRPGRQNHVRLSSSSSFSPTCSNFVTSHQWIFFFLTFSPKTKQKQDLGREEEHGRRREEHRSLPDELTTCPEGETSRFQKKFADLNTQV
jgi:hypothetical protein